MNLDRFNQFIAEGRIIRNAWHGKDAHGRETACLLAAFAEGLDRPSKCPAELMPDWLAELTPLIDDMGSLAAWPAMVQRYAACANGWSVLNEAAWRRVLLRFLDAALLISEPHDSEGVVAPVRALIARELGGAMPSGDEWRRAAADAATWAAWDTMTDALLGAIEREIEGIAK